MRFVTQWQRICKFLAPPFGSRRSAVLEVSYEVRADRPIREALKLLDTAEVRLDCSGRRSPGCRWSGVGGCRQDEFLL